MTFNKLCIHLCLTRSIIYLYIISRNKCLLSFLKMYRNKNIFLKILSPPLVPTLLQTYFQAILSLFASADLGRFPLKIT